MSGGEDVDTMEETAMAKQARKLGEPLMAGRAYLVTPGMGEALAWEMAPSRKEAGCPDVRFCQNLTGA